MLINLPRNCSSSYATICVLNQFLAVLNRYWRSVIRQLTSQDRLLQRHQCCLRNIFCHVRYIIVFGVCDTVIKDYVLV